MRSKKRLLSLLAIGAVAALLALLPAPVAAETRDRQQRDSIFIRGNREFNPANGVRSGSGTREDPYLISNWDLHQLIIKDTSAYIEISNVNVRGSMVLDWVGDRVNVHDNVVGDLRVNQNVKRKGEATSGRIVNNRFGIVGQLRHWDGVFAHNLVGAPGQEDVFDKLFKRRAVNFDGFNGAQFRDNVIYGFMDARLHGHHHSSSFEDASHYHGAAPEAEYGMLDHTQRYHEVFITNNKIYSDSSYALAYLDTAHQANDRTAASETDKALNKPHVHYTRVHMTGNKLIGSGLWIQVFNARDDRHLGTRTGMVEIADNQISLKRDQLRPYRSADGIYVHAARDLHLDIARNQIVGPAPDETMDQLTLNRWDQGAGIHLDDFNKAMIHLRDNEVTNRPFGIRASRFAKSVRWMIHGLRTKGVDEPVYYDNSVKNQPEEGP